MNTIPLFKSHFSIGRSILTLAKKGSSEANGSDSIVDIAIENNLKRVVLIDDSFSGFIEASKNLTDAGIKLTFGIRMICVSDASDKTEESLSKEHKVIVVAKNYNGYKKLIKIYSKAATDGFYYAPRTSCEWLKEHWNDNDLDLWIPFYDSYIYKNILTSNVCVPVFNFTEPKYVYEDNYLPFDNLIQDRIKDKLVIPAKSIYYKNKRDFKAYLTFRCINNRSSLDKPELEFMSSDEFCMDSWREQNPKGIDVS